MFNEITIPSDVCIQLKDNLKRGQLAIIIPEKANIVFMRKPGIGEKIHYKVHTRMMPFFITSDMLHKEGTHMRIQDEGQGEYALIAYPDSKYRITDRGIWQEGMIIGGKYYDLERRFLNTEMTFVPYTKTCNSELENLLALAKSYSGLDAQ